MAVAERTRLERFARLGRLRRGEERLARAAFQQAWAVQHQAEERVVVCRGAYRDIMLAANEKLRGVIDVKRLPVMQLMVADARRALQMAERQLATAERQSEEKRELWLSARQEMRVMDQAEGQAKTALMQVVRRAEQGQIDEVATLRAARA